MNQNNQPTITLGIGEEPSSKFEKSEGNSASSSNESNSGDKMDLFMVEKEKEKEKNEPFAVSNLATLLPTG